MTKSHLIFVPCPGIGHLISTVEFTKLLINRYEHLSITVLLIKSIFDPKVNDLIHSLSSSLSFPQRLQFLLLPSNPNLNTNSHSLLHPSELFDSMIENQKPNVRNAVSKINSANLDNSDPDSPRLAGFVVDVFCTAMADVATEFGVPTMVFFASGAAFLGFKLHIHTIRERDNVDTTQFNFKDSGTEFVIPSFENLVPASVFPGNVLDEGWARMLFNQARDMKNKIRGILVNTFEELESHAIQSFANGDLTVYPVGPILSLGDDRMIQQGPSDSDLLDWLDDQLPSSVLFLCFGSWGYFDEEGNQVREIARALESSGVHFVLSLRKPPSKGSIGADDYSDLEEVLPEGFLQRTAEIGRVIGWAPQTQILAHKAIGGFVSHCGWNSILESIYYGVPIATWPIHAEQQMNAFQLVCELKMSLEISLDYRRAFGNVGESGVISVERIEEGIKQVMKKESEVRKKVKKMSEMSKKALMEGGSSYSYLERFIHDILNWG